MKRAVIIDLEATCWEDKEFQKKNSEIIEIGAILWDEDAKVDGATWNTYIRPVKVPKLSEFCTNLTGITQAQVDAAPTARDAFLRLNEELYRYNLLGSTLVSWGRYDLGKLQEEMKREGVRFPFSSHINLKNCFAHWEHSRPKGLARAITSLGLEFTGRHHSGIDDAQNEFRIFKHLVEKAKHELVPEHI